MRVLNSLSFDRTGWRGQNRLDVRPHCQRTQRTLASRGCWLRHPTGCRRRRPRRRPRVLERVPVFRCYRMMTPRPTPPTKARRRRRKPLPQRGEGRKGRPPQQGRPKGPRREKLFPRTAMPTPVTTTRTGLQGPSPWRDREYPDSRITSWFLFFATQCLSNAAYNPAVRPGMIFPLRRAGP